MPYKKRTYRKRRPARKSSTTVRKVARQEAKKAIAQQVESKMFDGDNAAVEIDYSATNSVKSLTAGITQGTDDNQYIGRKIKPTYLQIRGIISHSGETNMVRMVVLQDKVSGVVLSGANIWQSVANVRAPLSPFERQYNDTFNVLYDKTINFSSKDDILYQTRIYKIKISGRILRQITFGDASGSVESGGLYIAFISDSGASAHPYTDFKWRLTYKDA